MRSVGCRLPELLFGRSWPRFFAAESLGVDSIAVLVKGLPKKNRQTGLGPCEGHNSSCGVSILLERGLNRQGWLILLSVGRDLGST